MSLYTLGDVPLKSPTTELLLYENPISNLLYEIRTSETHYRDQLSKLLGCCSPLKRQVANGFTNSVRKLIAYHTDLVRLLDHSEEGESIVNFISWVKVAIPVYQNYIQNYQLDSNNLKMEVQLKKIPLTRINQLTKFFNKIIDINEHTPQFKIQLDTAVLRGLIQLMEMAKDKNEKENLRIDLNTLHFDKVRSLDQGFHNTVAYFSIDQVIKRDYFQFDLLHQKCNFNDILVEIFQICDNTIAICSVEPVGRSLMFPLLKTNEFNLINNDLNSIHLENDFGVELKFTCPDRSQLSYWNNVFANLFANNHGLDTKFMEKHEHLKTLKNDKIGLGIGVELPKTMLRKSSPMISRHPSLNIQSSPSMDLLNSPDLESIEQYFVHDLDLDTESTEPQQQQPQQPRQPLSTKDTNISSFPRSNAKLTLSSDSLGSASPTLPLNIKKSNNTTKLTLDELQNSSTVSLPNFPNTNKSLNLNESIGGSSIDLSRFDNIKPNLKVKKRKSIFNIFSKKHNEPDFEIVKPEPQSNSNSASTSTSTSSKTIHQSTSNDTIPQQQPSSKQSMASLQKNVKNLTISTSSNSVNSTSELPSPFGKSSQTTKSLTPFEESTLSTSTVLKVFKNNTVVSKWNITQWVSIGQEYGNTMKFMSTSTASRLMALFTDSSMVPSLMIPIEGSSVVQSSALDVQIKCFSNIEDKRSIMLNIRCKDSYTLKQIMNEFEGKNQELSASSSDVFSAPSNSTSMSSVSVDEIQELGKPGTFKFGTGSNSNKSMTGVSSSSSSTTGGLTSQQYGSQTSLGSIQSTGSTIPFQTLLLKSDVKIKLHKMDEDEEWRPVSLGKFNISSNLGNPEYSKFEINLINKSKVETIIKNSNCDRLGKSGLKFGCLDEMGDESNYLIEFRNSSECEEIYEMLI